MQGLGNLVDEISEAATNDKGTYEKNGLLYCLNCNTPRQTVITLPFTGEKKKVNCACKCLVLQRDEAEKQRKEQEKRARAKRAKLASFEESDCAEMVFTKDDGKTPELSRQMQNYAKHFQTFKEQGQGLLLFGEVGNGKTFYSACIANALIDEGYSVLMTNFPSLVSRMQREAFKEDTAALVAKYDLLIVDDLGVERSSEFMQEKVFSIIDARYRAKKPIIVSTNISLQAMRQPADTMQQRIYGRLLERCVPIQFKGCDRRRGKTNYGEMLAILNS